MTMQSNAAMKANLEDYLQSEEGPPPTIPAKGHNQPPRDTILDWLVREGYIPKEDREFARNYVRFLVHRKDVLSNGDHDATESQPYREWSLVDQWVQSIIPTPQYDENTWGLWELIIQEEWERITGRQGRSQFHRFRHLAADNNVYYAEYQELFASGQVRTLISMAHTRAKRAMAFAEKKRRK